MDHCFPVLITAGPGTRQRENPSASRVALHCVACSLLLRTESNKLLSVATSPDLLTSSYLNANEIYMLKQWFSRKNMHFGNRQAWVQIHGLYLYSVLCRKSYLISQNVISYNSKIGLIKFAFQGKLWWVYIGGFQFITPIAKRKGYHRKTKHSWENSIANGQLHFCLFFTAFGGKGPPWLAKTKPVCQITEHSFQEPGVPVPRVGLPTYVWFANAFSTI